MKNKTTFIASSLLLPILLSLAGCASASNKDLNEKYKHILFIDGNENTSLQLYLHPCSATSVIEPASGTLERIYEKASQSGSNYIQLFNGGVIVTSTSAAYSVPITTAHGYNYLRYWKCENPETLNLTVAPRTTSRN